MELYALYKGISIGLLAAAVVGPIFILCVQKSLLEGWNAGASVAFGACLVDLLYSGIAAFGLTVVSDFLIASQAFIGSAGGAFLCYLGFKTFFTKPDTQRKMNGHIGFWQNFFYAFFLNLTSPLTILLFIAFFSNLGIENLAHNYHAASMLTLGVFTGAISWSLMLCYVASKIRHKMTDGMFIWLNRVSGLMIGGFGAWSIVKVMMRYI